MSFFRHREIYQSDVEREPAAAAERRRCRAHRPDESPASYSSAGCSPAWPASASLARLILQRQRPFAKNFPANGNLSPSCLSQSRGSVYSLFPYFRFSGAIAWFARAQLCLTWVGVFGGIL